MTHELSIGQWCRTKLSGGVTGHDRRRAGRPRGRGAPPRLEAPPADDREPGESWFESSRALARGLSVTEHDVALDVLLRVST